MTEGLVAYWPLDRKTDDLAWEGAIHENVDRWATQPGRVIRTLTAAIIHLGAIPSVREALGKDRRNLELLERRCEQEPNHPVMRAHLAREYERAGDFPRARDEAARAWETLLSIEDEQPGRYDPLLPLTLLAGYRLHEDHNDEVLALVETGRQLADAHPNLDFLEAEARRRLANEASDEEGKEQLLLEDLAVGVTRQHEEACVHRVLDRRIGAERARFHRAGLIECTDREVVIDNNHPVLVGAVKTVHGESHRVGRFYFDDRSRADLTNWGF